MKISKTRPWEFGAIPLLVLLGSCTSLETEVASKDAPDVVSLCELRLPDHLARANLSFNLVFEFLVGGSGVPNELKIVAGEYVSTELLMACVEDWRIYSEPTGTRVVGSQYWQHGVGWTKLAVRGEKLSVDVEPTQD